MRLPVKALVYPENCAHTETVPAKIAAVEVGRMPLAIVARQSVQPGPYPLWGGFDMHGVMEQNHQTVFAPFPYAKVGARHPCCADLR
jgi:hypothetical protein